MQTPLRELTTESLKLVWRQQKITTANLSGNAFVLFFLYSWSRVQDRSGQDLVFSLLIAGSVLFAGLWLHAATLATFQRNEEETPFMPALRRMHYYLPWAAAIGGTVALFTWMSSTLSMMVWVAGVGVILALLPLTAQAAGGLFSRKVACDIIFNEKYWLFATGVLVMGLYAPFSLFAWLPAFEERIVQVLVTGLRIGLAYVLTVFAWVSLAAFIGRMGMMLKEEETFAQAPAASLDATQPAHPVSENKV